MKKRILSLTLVLLMMFSLIQVTTVSAANETSGVYTLIDLQGNGASAQLYNTTGVYFDESINTYPMTYLDGFGYTDYLSRGGLSTSNAYGSGLGILNKAAVDAQKDTNGYIYAANGTPFMFKTDLGEKNGMLFGSAGNSGNNVIRTVNLNLGKDVKELSFVEVSQGAGTTKLTITIKYKGENETSLATHQIATYFMYGNKAPSSYIQGNVIGVSSINCFNNTNANSRLLFQQLTQQGYNLANATAPVSVAYYPGVVTLKIDPTKEAEYIKITSTGAHGSTAILAMTATKLSNEEKLAAQFANVPSKATFNYASYMAKKDVIDAALAAIAALVEDGATLTAEQQETYDYAVEMSVRYVEEPAWGVKELIEALPEADEISLDNYIIYNADVQNLQDQITDDLAQGLDEIDTALLVKFEAVTERVIYYFNTATVIDTVEALPDTDDVTKSNYNHYTDEIELVNELVDIIDADAAADALTTFNAFVEKYNEAKEEAAQLSAETKTKYITFDLTSVANGQNVTVQTPTGDKMDYSVGGYVLPAFLSAQTDEKSPLVVLNKKAWDELKAGSEDGYVYADNGTPFNFRTELDTKNAINLGGLYWAPNFKRTASIPVPSGRYKDIQLAIYASAPTQSSTIVDYIGEALTVKVNYEDGTSEELKEWKDKLAFSGEYSTANRNTLNQHIIGSGTTFGENSRKIATTFDNTLAKTPNLAYNSSGNAFSTGMILPVYNIEVDPYKTVKSISVDYYCRAPLSIMAVTGVLPDNDDYYDILTGLMDQVTEASIKTVEGKKVSSQVRVLYDAYVGREDATPLDAAYVEKYNWMVDLLDNYSITVTDANNATDYEETVITIDFDNPIDVANAKYKTKLLLNGTALKEGEGYAFSATDYQIKLTVPNDYNYNKTYKVIIDETLTDGQGKNFPLGVTYNYEFKPIAPFANETYTIKDGSTVITDINICKGKDAVVIIDYVNGYDEEQSFASVTGLFNKTTNKLIKSYYRQGIIDANDTISDEFTFEVPAGEDTYELRTFNFNSFAELFDITKAVIK